LAGFRTMLKPVASWILPFLAIFLVVAYPRKVHYQPIPGHLYAWSFSWHLYLLNIERAFQSPYLLFTKAGQSNLIEITQVLPLSLFFIFFAFFGSYIVGITKGIGDVFWKRNRSYRFFQGIAWTIDSIPMFGVVVLLELGTLYASMYLHYLPIHMIPDRSFIGGYIIPATILMWPPMMYLSRLLAISIDEEISSQYVLTARSKGLPLGYVFTRHIFRNCIPKLLNETGTVFTMIMSSLLALEYLGFRWGAALDMFVAMGHGELGERSLYANPSKFEISLVTDYLLLFACLTVLFRILAYVLQKRWQVTPVA